MKLVENIERIKKVMGILSESKSTRLKRLFPLIDQTIEDEIKEELQNPHFCRNVRTAMIFVETIADRFAEDFYYSYFDDLDDSSKEWGEIYLMINIYIEDRYFNRLHEAWENKCKIKMKDKFFD